MLGRPLATHPTAWAASDARVTLNATLDASVVPCSTGGVRADAAHLVVLDSFLPPSDCAALLARLAGDEAAAQPPDDRWERATSDGPAAALSWGLRDGGVSQLLAHPPAEMVELQSRLVKVYGREFELRHFGGQEGSGDASFVALPLVANAAVESDSFAWHVDADPGCTEGGYVNRERGRALLVTALLYLNSSWTADMDAETLFADPPTGTGIFVRPQCGRFVLMDADISHRLSPPSAGAGRPRYSLAWKLALIPRSSSQRCSIALPEWGRPSAFGSAARLEAVGRDLLKRSADEEPPTQPSPKRAAGGPPAQLKRAREGGEEGRERPGKMDVP